MKSIGCIYIAVTVNSASLKWPPGTAVDALYFAPYSLLNHMCTPNCNYENSVTDVSIHALQDIRPGSQLGISYIKSSYRVNVREIRRQTLKEAYGFNCSCSVCLGEEIIGSRFWLMDQQRRSLIAPCSRKFADGIMNQAWKEVYRCVPGVMDPLASIKVLEASMAVQTSVLDIRNISFILTIWHILMNYYILQDIRRVIEHLLLLGRVGMKAFFEYGTVIEINEIVLVVINCCSKLGLTDQVQELYVQFHIFSTGKTPLADSEILSNMAYEREILPFQTKSLLETYYEQTKPHVELCDIVCSILNICDSFLKQ